MGVLPRHDSEEIRVTKLIPTDSSLEDHLTATTSSFTNASSSYNSNLPIKKRLMLTEDASKSPKRLRFSTCQEEEDYYTQKVKELNEMMRELYDPLLLATKKATIECPPLYVEDNNVNKKKKKTAKIPIKIKREPMVVISNEITEQLKRLIDEMNGSDLTLVIQKRLFKSDLDRGQNRLNMPIKQLQSLNFLKPDEKVILDEEQGIEVGLMGPTLQMYNEPMVLKKWYMLRTSNYVLMNKWNDFVAKYSKSLKIGSNIQVWSFRRNQELCFALVIVGDE